MGYYIEIQFDGSKAKAILAHPDANAREVLQDEARQIVADDNGKEAVIVVINNVAFEAAGLAYSPAEFDSFTETDDTRLKRFIAMDAKLAAEFSGYKKR